MPPVGSEQEILRRVVVQVCASRVDASNSRIVIGECRASGKESSHSLVCVPVVTLDHAVELTYHIEETPIRMECHVSGSHSSLNREDAMLHKVSRGALNEDLLRRTLLFFFGPQIPL